ncbi:MAG: hypothetical protein ACAH59_01790 [Pseudobdellovibrionaceae bacterium]
MQKFFLALGICLASVAFADTKGDLKSSDLLRNPRLVDSTLKDDLIQQALLKAQEKLGKESLIKKKFNITEVGRGGIDSAGGADQEHFLNGVAWFNKRRVSFCINRDAAYFLDFATSRSLIEGAIKTWESYIETKRISVDIPVFEFQAKCDDQVDLVFYLGISDARTSQTLEGRYTEPLGVSQLESFDLSTLNGRGWVWIKNLSKLPQSPMTHERMFYILALHELGHVLGNSHVDGTVMDQHISDFIVGRPISSGYDEVLPEDGVYPEPSNLYRHVSAIADIDMKRELFICESCPFRIDLSQMQVRSVNQSTKNLGWSNFFPDDRKMTLVYDRSNFSFLYRDGLSDKTYEFEEFSGLGISAIRGSSLFKVLAPLIEYTGAGPNDIKVVYRTISLRTEAVTYQVAISIGIQGPSFGTGKLLYLNIYRNHFDAPYSPAIKIESRDDTFKTLYFTSGRGTSPIPSLK